MFFFVCIASLLVLGGCQNAPPIIGFDCNQTEPEILSVSTLEVGPCPSVNALTPKTNPVYGQIIQRHYLDSVHVRTCQLIKSTFYFRCGGNWLNYQVYPPSVGVIVPLTSTKCNEIHRSGFYQWSSKKEAWADLAPNNTFYFTANQIGWTDNKGYCEGGDIQIHGQDYSNIVVQVSFTISLRESWATVDHETGKINVEGALSCSYSAGSCKDDKTGTHSWSPSVQKCPDEQYKLLYQGQMNVTSSPQNNRVMLSVNNPPFLFTAELGLKTYVCGMNLQMTEFPGILMAPQQNRMYQVSLPPPSPLDIKLITYLNAKLTFTYHNVLDSAQKMYRTAILETCHVEREMLRNRIEIIRLNSAAGGLSSLLNEGMFAKINGEVIHMIKCQASQVLFKTSAVCYDALPIVYKNTTMFLLPNTHIISPYANEIPCSTITPVTYRIGGQWWSYVGTFQRVQDPVVLSPKTKLLPQFNKIRSFSQGGMYSQEDVAAVQKLLVFPSLRESITSKFADGLTHFSGNPVAMDLTEIMSEADWRNVAKRQVEQVWGYFSAIGSTISGFIGIYFVLKVLKCAFDSLLDVHELYRVFGCSFFLIGAVWGRLGQFFLRRHDQARRSPDPEPRESGEMDSPPAESIPLQGYVSQISHLYPTAPKFEDTAC